MPTAASARRPEVVVVTGGSAGLGRAIVQAFALEGAHIGVLARDPERLAATAAEVEMTREDRVYSSITQLEGKWSQLLSRGGSSLH